MGDMIESPVVNREALFEKIHEKLILNCPRDHAITYKNLMEDQNKPIQSLRCTDTQRKKVL